MDLGNLHSNYQRGPVMIYCYHLLSDVIRYYPSIIPLLLVKIISNHHYLPINKNPINGEITMFFAQGRHWLWRLLWRLRWMRPEGGGVIYPSVRINLIIIVRDGV